MILQWPHDILKKKTTDIPDKETANKFLPYFKELIERYKDKALGLAAPQTGLSYSLLWIKDFGIMINPVIVDKSEEIVHSMNLVYLFQIKHLQWNDIKKLLFFIETKSLSKNVKFLEIDGLLLLIMK